MTHDSYKRKGWFFQVWMDSNLFKQRTAPKDNFVILYYLISPDTDVHTQSHKDHSDILLRQQLEGQSRSHHRKHHVLPSSQRWWTSHPWWRRHSNGGWNRGFSMNCDTDGTPTSCSSWSPQRHSYSHQQLLLLKTWLKVNDLKSTRGYYSTMQNVSQAPSWTNHFLETECEFKMPVVEAALVQHTAQSLRGFGHSLGWVPFTIGAGAPWCHHISELGGMGGSQSYLLLAGESSSFTQS